MLCPPGSFGNSGNHIAVKLDFSHILLVSLYFCTHGLKLAVMESVCSAKETRLRKVHLTFTGSHTESKE